MLETTQLIINTLEKELPATFSRQEAAKHIKGIFSAGTLANFDCRGEGAPSVKIGRIVCYERTSFLLWLEARIKPRKLGKIGGGAE